MSSLSVFNFNSNEVRVEIKNGEPLFCLKDVTDILEIQNSRDLMAKQLKKSGVDKIYISHASGRKLTTFINEANLYRVIFRSNKDDAVKFQDWVFEEVLPTIRKTGSYTLTINPQQQRAIQEAVNDSVHRVAGRTHQGVYSSIKKKYGIAKYDQLPASQFDDCISWLNDGFTKPKVLELDEELKSAIYDVCYHAIENNANYAKLLRALRVFHEDSANYDLRHAREGSIAAVHLSQLLDLRNKLNKPLMSSPNILNCYGGNSIHYAISVF